ncbi:hypothetical protein EMCRGX_G015784 [Ephydatia muelleri]
MESLAGLSAQELIKRKDDIEEEIRTQLLILDGQKSVGMDGSLIDAEGFPRSDIDLYAVRTARNRVICLRNDHKIVMAAVEKKIHDMHAEARESGKATNEQTARQSGVPVSKAFAKINSVTDGSPAALAGLQVGDAIVEFGTLNAANFSALSDLALIAQHSVERPVRVTVNRNGTAVGLFLTPRPWGGKGVLGCNVTIL